MRKRGLEFADRARCIVHRAFAWSARLRSGLPRLSRAFRAVDQRVIQAKRLQFGNGRFGLIKRLGFRLVEQRGLLFVQFFDPLRRRALCHESCPKIESP